MLIQLLVPRRLEGRPHSITDDLITSLRAAGVQVQLTYPDEIDVAAVPLAGDVCVLKAKSRAALQLGHRYHEAGVPTISPYPVTELCRDKLATNEALTRAGLPVPACMAVSTPADVVAAVATGPVILKPVRGSQGRGIVIVRSETDIPTTGWDEAVFAQRYYEPDSHDRKIYRIGDEIFCVERIWPPVTVEDKLGRVVELDAATRALAHRCGEVLGTDVYGVDIIFHAGRPWVVDMSSFPGFKGVPDAARRLAARILRAADVTDASEAGSLARTGLAVTLD